MRSLEPEHPFILHRWQRCYSAPMPKSQKRLITAYATLISLTLCLTLCLTTTSWAGRSWWGQVVRVIDGDSLIVQTEAGQDVKIRLAQIDAPEFDQPFGKTVTDSLRALIMGRMVLGTPQTKDRNGRTVAMVYSVDGLSLNWHLIERGHAWWYRKYAPDCIICEHSESKARIRKLGLWKSDRRPIPPWEWRRGLRI